MLEVMILLGGLGLAVLVLRFIALPKAEQHDRKKQIERNMRQSIRDNEYERQAAIKLLRESGTK